MLCREGKRDTSDGNGWQKGTTLTAGGINFSAGPYVLKLVRDREGTRGYTGNFNYITIDRVSSVLYQ